MISRFKKFLDEADISVAPFQPPSFKDIAKGSVIYKIVLAKPIKGMAQFDQMDIIRRTKGPYKLKTKGNSTEYYDKTGKELLFTMIKQ